MSEARSASGTVDVRFDEPVSLRPDHLSEVSYDRDGGPAEQISDLKDLVDQSAGGISALPQRQSDFEKGGFDFPTTVLETRKLIA